MFTSKRSYNSAYDSDSDSVTSENQPFTAQHSDQKTARLAAKRIFRQNLLGEWVNFETNSPDIVFSKSYVDKHFLHDCIFTKWYTLFALTISVLLHSVILYFINHMLSENMTFCNNKIDSQQCK